MTMWLILKTDIAKEFAVAEALTALGHECWVPTYVCEVRERKVMGPGVTVRVRKARERPLLPSLLLTNAVNHPAPSLSVRHLQGIWRDTFQLPLMVPETQVIAFRARVEEVNAREIARIRNRDKKKPKKRMKLDPSLADELKAALFGSAAMENAA